MQNRLAQLRKTSLRHTGALATLLLAVLAAAAPAVAAETLVNTQTTSDQNFPAIACDASGNFVVAWHGGDQDGSGYGIFAQRFLADGTPQGLEFQVNAFTTNDQGNAAAAMADDGKFTFAWQSQGQDAGTSWGVYARRYLADGTPEGASFLVHSIGSGNQSGAAIAMAPDGRCVIAWQGYGTTDDAGIWCRLYAADGSALGTEFLVHAADDAIIETGAAVAMDDAGNFVVAWQRADGDADGSGIFARLYDSTGTALTAEFAVNTTTTGDQIDPTVAMDADGDFAVAWEDAGADGDLAGIFGQRYDSTGAAQGTEFAVNTTTALTQQSPSLGMDDAGNFLVSWESDGQDGDSYGVYGREYDHQGTALGGEFLVNTTTTGIQIGGNHAVVSRDSGDWLLGWYGNGAGDDIGIFYDTHSAAVQADLQVGVTVDSATGDPGDAVAFTVAVDNLGPDDATGIVIQDAVPAGMTFVSATPSTGSYNDGTSLWTLGDLSNGAGATLVLNCTVDAGTESDLITNTASVSAVNEVDPAAANDSDSVDFNVNALSVDLALAKTVDHSGPSPGETIVYTLTVTNNGPGDGTGIAVTDILPAGVTFVSSTPDQGSYDSGTGIWTVGGLASAAAVSLDITCTVDAGTFAQTITNDADISAADQDDPTAADDSASRDITVRSADLELSKSVINSTPAEGGVVIYNLVVTNRGPDTATGVAVADTLPAGVTFVSAVPIRGSYDEATGIWTVGNLGDDEFGMLTLTGTVDAGTAGSTITNTARVSSPASYDANPGTNIDTADITVDAADLQLTKVVDVGAPNEGDAVTYTLTVFNLGPIDASGVAVADTLPAGLTFVSSTPSQGAYDEATGLWTVGDLANTGAATLDITGTVNAGTWGSTIQNTARITASEVTDPQTADNVDSASLTVQAADLGLTKTVDDPAPVEGATVVYTLTIQNLGPDGATNVAAADTLPAGLTFVSDSPSQGTYDEVTGVWTVGDVAAAGSATLQITCTVDEGVAGAAISNTARIQDADQADPVAGNDVDSALLTAGTSNGAMTVATVDLEPAVLTPGGDAKPVLEFQLTNLDDEDDRLEALTVHNASTGPGTTPQLDMNWAEVSLWIRSGSRLNVPPTAGPGAVTTGAFSGGSLEFTDLDMPIPAGESVTLVVQGAAALGARDGDRLAVSLTDTNTLTFGRSIDLTGTWPLISANAPVVDGLVADQIVLHEVAPGLFPQGSRSNLVLDFTVPANGYEADVLERLNVVNLGDAAHDTDIIGLDGWVDDGDGNFDPDRDTALGRFAFTGARWELTGIGAAISTAGLRVFVSADIDEDAAEGRSVQMALPPLPDVGIGTASGNNGPLDRPVANPYAQALSASNRVLITSWAIEAGTAVPGRSDVPLLQFVATNTYDEPRVLSSLTVTNGSTGAAAFGSAALDAELSSLSLRADGDGDGELDDLSVDPVLAAGSFTDGVATFPGISWTLPAGGTGHLFLTGDVSTPGARDGDVLSAYLAAGSDLVFETTTAVSSAWPLDSQAAWTVDGMTAAQIGNGELPSRTLAAGEGPALVLDITVPRNGYEDDTLVGLTLVNAGTAEPADVSELRLWRDGGDDEFTPGAGDDIDLGALLPVAGAWSSSALTEALGEPGARLFVGVTIDTNPTESATLQFTVPVGGIAVASDNDGPADAAVTAIGIVRLSAAPLLASMDFVAPQSTVGGEIVLRMIVRNAGDENLVNVAPTAPSASGSGSVTLSGGPSPASLDLAVGHVDTFTWTGTASGAGTVLLTATAEGTTEGSGQSRSTIPVTTRESTIYIPVSELGVYSVTNMPFTLNRGQTDVVPLTLTFLLPDDELSSTAEITSLHLHLEQEDGTSIVPADLLDRVTVSEGALNYLQTTDLATGGDHIDLLFSEPIRVEPGDPVSVAVRLDISATTGVPDFRVTIDEPDWFDVRDAISHAPVATVLHGGSFPIESVAGTIVFEATGLEISAHSLADGTVGVGQQDRPLLVIDLHNPGLSALGSTVLLDSLLLTIEDADGLTIGDPGARLDAIRLVSADQILTEIDAADAEAGVINLTPPTAVSVPANGTVTLEIRGDFAADSPSGPFRVHLGDAELLSARDANSGEPVLVSYTGGQITGPELHVEQQASRVLAAGDPLLPSTLVIGARSASAFDLELRHPDGSDYAHVLIDSLRLSCRDDDRILVPPAALIDKLELRAGDTVLGVLYEPSGTGVLTLPLSGLQLAPGETAQLSLLVDFEPDAPPTSLEFVLDGDGFFARDANLGSSVALEPESGAELPLTSGLTRLQAAPEELTVGFEDRMPAVLAADGTETPTALLRLANPAGAETASIALGSLTLRAADDAYSAQSIGAWLEEATVYQDSEPWGEATIADDDSVAVIVPDAPFELLPGQSVDLEIRIRVRSARANGSLRLGLGAGDIAIDTGGGLASIRIEADNGSTFPFWTAVGNFSAATLADSYSNFPNPFAAGREETRFVFQLEADATVTLRLMTGHWRPVATILEREPRAAGLHQDDAWDGRNGSGVVVQNGVYVAELVVEYADGTRERHLRKVAVVR